MDAHCRYRQLLRPYDPRHRHNAIPIPATIDAGSPTWRCDSSNTPPIIAIIAGQPQGSPLRSMTSIFCDDMRRSVDK
jgi:hypothetical protein